MIKKTIMLFLCTATMFCITFLSSQSAEQSTKLSVGISEKIVDSNPESNEFAESERNKAVHQTNDELRDIAHFGLFFVLGIVLYNTMRTFKIRKSFILSLGICIVYALFDELYQKFLCNGRTFQFIDLVKDWSGSIVGISLVAMFENFKKKK